MRFSKIAVIRDEPCGLTVPEADLVCLRGGRPELIEAGPLIDFGMNGDVAAWNEWCAVRQDGSVVCDQLSFEGTARRVSVGLFNACVGGPEGITCLVPPAIGGIESPPAWDGPFDVDMGSLCYQPLAVHSVCVGRDGSATLPTAGHYWAAAATPRGACAAVMAPPQEVALPGGIEPEIAEVLGHSQVACFSPDGVEVVLEGRFDKLDADSNGSGCAYGGEKRQIECWGNHASLVPEGLTESPAQIAVSTTHACLLAWDGSIRCFGP